jgi:hypothetical protein
MNDLVDIDTNGFKHGMFHRGESRLLFEMTL